MATSTLQELLDTLAADRSSAHARFPSMAVWAVRDERVGNALARRFGEGQVLDTIDKVHCDFGLGLQLIYFRFRRTSGLDLDADAVLAIMDWNCRIVGIVDGWNPAQPNPLLPRLRGPDARASAPFVLARPMQSTRLEVIESPGGPPGSEHRTVFWLGQLGDTEGPCGPGAIASLCEETTLTYVPKDFPWGRIEADPDMVCMRNLRDPESLGKRWCIYFVDSEIDTYACDCEPSEPV